ncbi:MAG: benzoate transporter [Rhodospirillaceae bacterium]|nr:benzoate transporter [Rhodospirillaceae bacterium]MAX63625.1 benzoate transporter [Rhodospirillaceae bacterium]MBB56677.1 benzoate transporter [Rhodospirillaceae bacterium]|tara:strand:+ start:6781 stop:7950 length:1170 start_codon:yes stop_codon:yes gene_type:complete
MRLSLFSNALVAVLVGFGGSVAIVLAGVQAVGATPAQSASWISALCLAMFVTSTTLSVLHRMPIVTAWSTPGAALIAATAIGGVPTYSIEVAVGAFLFAAALIMLSAAVKPLATLIAKIPSALASAMLAGVLIGFSIAVFDQAAQDPLLVLPLVAVFLIVRMVSATWAVIAVLGAGVAWAAILGKIAPMTGGIELTSLELISPVFDPAALIGLGLPLFLVSMASQNLPGFAVLRAAGYEPPTRSALAVTGLASLLTAPFGAHTTTLAAITASLCTGPDTHPDPNKRWISGIFYGLGYLILAGVGVSVVAGFAALPTGVIVTVAGLALIGPLMGSLSAALAPEATRFPAVLTLTATASGLTLFGIGSAFWGLVLGLLALGLDKLAKKMRD